MFHKRGRRQFDFYVNSDINGRACFPVGIELIPDIIPVDFHRERVLTLPVLNPYLVASRLIPSGERAEGIEPSCVAWKATVLPLNYARVGPLVMLSERLCNCKSTVDAN